ncbi:Pycsar system effector family protein [uncultured Algoriphagus sp.]|uniref:Pycsar system effector family protein n=1 Tax=uncultured Algoriphagus sp. TaxID=417365 RepID=UPI0030EC5B70
MEEVLEPKKDKTERATQTFFRVTFMNNCNLLQIADNKANIVISINALVISSVVAIIGYGTLSHQFDYERTVTLIPIMVLITTCLVSTILAVQAARPKFLGRRKNNEEEVKSSMMFFGVSSNFTLQEYLTELDEILPSKKQVQEQMAISLYYQGKVLNRKYKLLAHAYTVFIIGLAIGVVTFFIYLIAL